ncbi:MAG: nuclear transport factor 2 family protein [Acidimicrobiia bacterium]|nr:nuclear transport factor 2 family protein [Acidimicrobiia bacterium]
MTPEMVQDWIHRYIDAWRSYDTNAISELFTAEATYAYNPWDQPLVGREAIVAGWLNDPDEPGSWEAEYRPLHVIGHDAVIVGETRYADGRTWANLFVVSFDGAGRCTSFVEWYMKKPTSDV